jgi:putative copper export protein
MNFFAVLNHWVHLVCVIFWIGGTAFQLLIISPFTKKDAPPASYLVAIANRFQKWIGPLIFILLVTGGMNLGFRRAGHPELPPGYISALGVKVMLVAVIASIHFFGFIRSHQDDSLNTNTPTLPRAGYAKLTLAIGVIIIFIAAMLRQWKFPG